MGNFRFLKKSLCGFDGSEGGRRMTEFDEFDDACIVCGEPAFCRLFQVNPEDRTEQDTEHYCSMKCLKWAYD